MYKQKKKGKGKKRNPLKSARLLDVVFCKTSFFRIAKKKTPPTQQEQLLKISGFVHAT